MITTAIVIAVVLLFEGGRAVPAGSIIIRRVLFGDWTIVDPRAAGAGWRLVSWLPPFSLTLVLPPRDATADFDERLTRVRLARAGLTLVGGVQVLLLVLGIPAAVQYLGATGLGAAVLAAATDAVVIALIGWQAIRRLRGSAIGRRVRILGWLWPFSSPFAVESVLEEALGEVNRIRILERLLPPADFVRFVRPRAFDRLEREASDGELDQAKTADQLAAFIDATAHPDPEARSICRRCGGSFRLDAGSCPDCDVTLTRV